MRENLRMADAQSAMRTRHVGDLTLRRLELGGWRLEVGGWWLEKLGTCIEDIG
jgi:hypothetical protein